MAIVGGLERSVARPVGPEILARVSPLWHGHVIANVAATSVEAAPAPKPNRKKPHHWCQYPNVNGDLNVVTTYLTSLQEQLVK